MDPRILQIGSLTTFLLYGMLLRGFDVSFENAGMIVGSALGCQWFCSRLVRIPFEPKSALISALSLCLLLRSNSSALVLLTTLITISSKFCLRFRGKHLFNPTNFGLAVMLLCTDLVWVSPGQWGSSGVLAFFIASAGCWVTVRALRSDVSAAFIMTFALLIIGRSVWLGDPLAIPIHRLASGALILFTFFMISDPKTTPNNRGMRVLFGVLVAFGGYVLRFHFFEPNALLYSLVFFSLFVPFFDWFFPGTRFRWEDCPTKRREQHLIVTPQLQPVMSGATL